MLLKKALKPTSRDAQTLRRVSKERWVSAWASSVLSDEAALINLTAHSVWHPNGFLKVVVAQGGDGERVRLHVWPRSEASSEGEDIHDHYWTFSSVVVQGRLEIDSYEITDGRRGLPFRVKELPGFHRDIRVGETYDVEDLGVTFLCRKSRTRVGEGEVYSMASCEIHRVKKVGGGITATLMLQGPPAKARTRVFLKAPHCNKNQIGKPQRAASRSDVSDLLLQLCVD
jgi:hypothetical protein